MRVNVYAEEIMPITDGHGDRVTRVDKDVVKGLKHSAIQILLGERFIHSDNAAGIDDDTPALKFWYCSENERDLLVKIFEKAIAVLNEPESKR